MHDYKYLHSPKKLDNYRYVLDYFAPEINSEDFEVEWTIWDEMIPGEIGATVARFDNIKEAEVYLENEWDKNLVYNGFRVSYPDWYKEYLQDMEREEEEEEEEEIPF